MHENICKVPLKNDRVTAARTRGLEELSEMQICRVTVFAWVFISVRSHDPAPTMYELYLFYT